MRVGVLSDTHGRLRPRVLELLAGCDRLSANPDVLSREETTTYRVLPRTRPMATQPTTQPSLGESQR